MSAAAPVVEVRGLSKRYGHLTAVDRIHMTARRGEVYGFLGSNGAGRTTTLRMLLGLIAPTTGEVSVLGYGTGTPESRGRVGPAGRVTGVLPVPVGGGSTCGSSPPVTVHSYDGTLRVRVDERHTGRVNQTLVEAAVADSELRRGERQLKDVFLGITDESVPGPTAHEPTPELCHV